MRNASLFLITLLLGCGGSDSSGPGDANVLGTWLFTFTTNNSCSLTQIAVILSESPTGAPIGDHGTYVFDCAGVTSDETGVAGSVAGWQVSGNDFSLQFTTSPPRRLSGTVNGSSMSGTFLWQPAGVSYGGTFTAVRQ